MTSFMDKRNNFLVACLKDENHSKNNANLKISFISMLRISSTMDCFSLDLGAKKTKFKLMLFLESIIFKYELVSMQCDNRESNVCNAMKFYAMHEMLS